METISKFFVSSQKNKKTSSKQFSLAPVLQSARLLAACCMLAGPAIPVLAPHLTRTGGVAFALVRCSAPPLFSSSLAARQVSPQGPRAVSQQRAWSARRFTRTPLLTLGVLGIVAVPQYSGGSSLTGSRVAGSALRCSMASEAGGGKPLTGLLATSKEAFDSIGVMVRRFYLAINSETSTLKADKSVFTIADGIVQELLAEYLYAGPGKFRAIVGEEDTTNTNIKQRPYTVDTLSVPPVTHMCTRKHTYTHNHACVFVRWH
jgi:hypothetical protein